MHGINKSLSVVIPCYNSETYIGQAIESVLNQNHVPIELIVVDDGSTDNSKSIISSYGERLKFLSSTNLGACSARNLGLYSSQNDYVIFLDSDDYLLGDSISKTINQSNNFDILFGNFFYEKSKTKYNSGRDLNARGSLDLFSSWIDGNFIPPCSVIWRKKFLLDIGCWDVSIKRNQDGELILRALLNNPVISFTEKHIGVYVQHESHNRVSKRKGRDIITGDINIFEKLVDLARSKKHFTTKIASSFAKALYSVAYEAYYLGYDDLGDLALKHARLIGLNRHYGSTKHRFIAAILGLKIKMHLSRRFKN